MPIRRLAVLCLAVFLTTGCREETPADFALRLGESGGFTGWTTGYHLTPEREVIQFTDRLQGEVEQRTLGHLQAEQRDELWQRIAASRAFDTPPTQGSGDLVRFLEVVAHGETRRVAWTVGPPSDSPPPMVLLFDHCRDVLAGLEPPPPGDS